jgi:dephospho-CoA kinase
MACKADPGRAANVHVRPVDSPTWRDALLLRDWLRATPAAVGEYAALKQELAAQPHETIDDYAERKTPWIHGALARADEWAARTGWSVD